MAKLVRPRDHYPDAELVAYNARSVNKAFLDRARVHAALNRWTMELAINDLLARGIASAEAERRAARKAKTS